MLLKLPVLPAGLWRNSLFSPESNGLRALFHTVFAVMVSAELLATVWRMSSALPSLSCSTLFVKAMLWQSPSKSKPTPSWAVALRLLPANSQSATVKFSQCWRKPAVVPVS